MSTLDADGFLVESNPPHADAVREPLGGEPSPPSPPEAVDAPAPSEPASEGETETPETPERGRERGADGKYVKRDSVQARIDKAVAQQRAAERERDTFKIERDKLWERIQEGAKRFEAGPSPEERAEMDHLRANPPVIDPAKGPELSDFASYEEWVDARASWVADNKWQAIQAQQEKLVAKQQHERAILTHTERIQSFAAKTPDYFEKIQEAAALPVSAAMEAAIIASDDGPAIAYFLATHPEEGAQLAYETRSLTTAAASVVRRLLESKVHAPTTAAPGPVAGGYRPTVSAPIKPVGSAPVAAEPSPDDLPFGPDYVERMNALERKKARRGY